MTPGEVLLDPSPRAYLRSKHCASPGWTPKPPTAISTIFASPSPGNPTAGTSNMKSLIQCAMVAEVTDADTRRFGLWNFLHCSLKEENGDILKYSCHATQPRRSVRRGTPFGQADWTKATAAQLGLEDTLRPPAWPRKMSTMSKDTSLTLFS